MTSSRRSVGVVLFDGFELLDVFGPLEFLGAFEDEYELVMLGPEVGEVPSRQGPGTVATVPYANARAYDIALVPGGIATRQLVDDEVFVGWLGRWAASCTTVTSVCTGSGLLARAGLLDGYRATSNKAAFSWAQAQSSEVDWVAQARWVHDRDRWTSSGVAAGIDMAVALVAHQLGEDRAVQMAERLEIDWHRDPTWDPFAAKYGLVG